MPKPQEGKQQPSSDAGPTTVSQAQDKSTKPEEAAGPSSSTPQEKSVEHAETPEPVDEGKTAEIFLGIDAINWSTVKHRYGFATDVPGWLRALRSPSRSSRNSAYKKLEDNLIHQGTAYEASVLSVPYLLRMIADEQTPDRERIIHFLVTLAIGDPSNIQPRDFNVMQFRDLEKHWRNADVNDMLEKKEKENPGTTNELRRRIIETQRYEMLSGIDCYNAVRAGVPTFLSLLLEDEDPAVRIASAYVVAWFAEDARSDPGGILPTLTKVMDIASPILQF